jgi:3-oxoacyl-[acyl-carrier-protein] synthase-3
MADIAVEMMEKHNIAPEELAWLVPHQANMRIIEATARRMGIRQDQVMINIQRYGNTTAATIPLCLWEWEEKLRLNNNLILAAFGGGFTWGAIYVKWAYNGSHKS